MATMSVGGINDSVRRGTHSDQTKARAILEAAPNCLTQVGGEKTSATSSSTVTSGIVGSGYPCRNDSR